MNAKDILARKFEKGFNGYRIDDVDEFVKEVSEEFGNLQKENRDLEKKLEVLADRIREYRNDEDALKEALLGAQKQGQQAIADAKGKAKKIIEDAETQSNVIITAAEEKKKLLGEEGEKLKSDAKNESHRIIDEANKEAEKISAEMNYQIEMNKEILTRLKNEIYDFSERIAESYKVQLERIDAIPKECENEYILRTADEHEKAKEKNQKSVKANNVNSSDLIKSVVKSNEEDEDLDITKIYDELGNDGEKGTKNESNSGEQSFEINENTFDKVFKESKDSEDTAEESGEKSDEKTSNVNNNIFFKKTGLSSNVKEPLDFGTRAKDGGKKKI